MNVPALNVKQSSGIERQVNIKVKDKLSGVIRFCPNCKEELSNSKKFAQGVKECKGCGCRFLILDTHVPKNLR